MASSGKGNRRRRSRKDPSWYDKSVAALSADQEEVMEIPIEKVGLVIGTRGWRLQEIRDQTGIQITIKAGNQAHLRGTAEQLQEAKKIIEEVVNPVCILEVLHKQATSKPPLMGGVLLYPYPHPQVILGKQAVTRSPSVILKQGRLEDLYAPIVPTSFKFLPTNIKALSSIQAMGI